MNMRNMLSLLLLTTLLASCTSYKNVPYLQDPESVNQAVQNEPLYDARIMPKDLISITVNTTDPQASAPFNPDDADPSQRLAGKCQHDECPDPPAIPGGQ